MITFVGATNGSIYTGMTKRANSYSEAQSNEHSEWQSEVMIQELDLNKMNLLCDIKTTSMSIQVHALHKR